MLSFPGPGGDGEAASGIQDVPRHAYLSVVAALRGCLCLQRKFVCVS